VDPSGRETWLLSRRLFVAGVALVYALAFAQLGVQVQGLFGSRGIAPLAEQLDRLAAAVDGWQRLAWPSLLWLDASDAMLSGICVAGTLSAVLVLFGVLPRLLLLLCWLLYLSLVRVGEPFLEFQWDTLLLETGLLAALFAPGGLRPFGRGERAPSPVLRWLIYWLLCRLLLLSGLLKLASGDPSWRDGTALDFHYWTQPLPHVLSHYVHWLPAWSHVLSLWLMFAIELGTPLLLLVPFARRRCRQIAAAAVVLLMLAIAATGNYGFFNLLAAVPCVLLLDDRAWRALLRRPAPAAPPAVRPTPKWRRITVALFAVLTLLVTADRGCEAFDWDLDPPWPVDWLHRIAEPLDQVAAPFESFNNYGLFRVMTRERPELLVEGSADGVDWRPWGFRYKPLDLERAPVFAGLYMPRLDWQLWFAALDHRLVRDSAWTLGLLRRLLEGSPPVLGLLGDNPFPERPPRYARIRISQYEFSTPDERVTGRWWQRSEPKDYSGAWTLENGELRRAR